MVNNGRKSLGRIPVVIGEIGIPYDINNRHALVTGDFDKPRELMDALIGAMEDHQVGFTLWNYNPNNSIEHGDGWNREDFSVVNGDEQGVAKPDFRNVRLEKNELYRGGRVLDVVIRPYAAKIAGEPIRSEWDYRTLRYELDWRCPNAASTTKTSSKALLTEVFIPDYHYEEHELLVSWEGGDWTFDAAKQTLYLQQKPGVVEHKLVLGVRKMEAHINRRVLMRRMAFPPKFPWNWLSSVESDVRWELQTEWEMYSNFVGIAVFLATILAAISLLVYG